jgi:hypothetical protein
MLNAESANEECQISKDIALGIRHSALTAARISNAVD